MATGALVQFIAKSTWTVLKVPRTLTLKPESLTRLLPCSRLHPGCQVPPEYWVVSGWYAGLVTFIIITCLQPSSSVPSKRSSAKYKKMMRVGTPNQRKIIPEAMWCVWRHSKQAGNLSKGKEAFKLASCCSKLCEVQEQP